MLKNELVKIKLKMTKSIIDHYSKLNYIITNNTVEVYTKDLHKGSNFIVTINCDNCNTELNIQYKKYYESTIRNNSNLYYCEKCKYCRIKKTNLEKYGVENVMKVKNISEKTSNTLKKNNKKLSKKEKSNLLKTRIIKKYVDLNKYYNDINEKKKKNCLEKYGVENVMLIKTVKNKGQLTCLEKYGQYNVMLIKSFVNKSIKKGLKTKIKKKLIIPEEKLTEFEKYKKITRRLIYKFKKRLFEEWNGYDYYDDEYIKDNLNLYHTDRKYPTIDHKISIFKGFNDNIDPYIIGDISNMCITKREINSSKYINIEPGQKYLKNNNK